MRQHGIPLTRANYLQYNYPGGVPKQIHPEDEADFPEFARKA